jgi:hypothetical protein
MKSHFVAQMVSASNKCCEVKYLKNETQRTLFLIRPL